MSLRNGITQSRGEGLLTTDPRLVRPLWWLNQATGGIGLATLPDSEFAQNFRLYSETGSDTLSAPAEPITLRLTPEYFWRKIWFARLVLNYSSYVLRGWIRFFYQGKSVLEFPLDIADTVSGTSARYPRWQFPFSARLMQDGVESDEPETIEMPLCEDSLVWHARHNMSNESNFWHVRILVAPVRLAVAADEVKVQVDGWTAGSAISGTYGNIYFGLAVQSFNLPWT